MRFHGTITELTASQVLDDINEECDLLTPKFSRLLIVQLQTIPTGGASNSRLYITVMKQIRTLSMLSAYRLTNGSVCHTPMDTMIVHSCVMLSLVHLY